MSDIRMSATAAFNLVKSAADLFFDGTGINLQPSDEMTTDVGFIDEISPEDGDVRYWANQLLFFVRTVHGILQNALLEAENEGEI